MKLDSIITLVFKNKEGNLNEITIPIKNMLEITLDDLYEYLEDDYEIYEVLFPLDKITI